ncbi:MAG: hypothetical protein CMF39_03210 [Legionellaceae bacterium]|nr:hypothetical protein [Legionellaceae bacterium]
MKKYLPLFLAISLSSTALAAVPQLHDVSLTVGQQVTDHNFVVDADACSSTAGTCDDSKASTRHDHESKPIESGWSDWAPNWQQLAPGYQVVGYHIAIRRPGSGQDYVACGHEFVNPARQAITLHLFKLFGSLHCVAL